MQGEDLKVKSVGVVGLGTMGAGIAEVFAKSGAQVTGVDRDQPSLDRGRSIITSSLGRAVERGRLEQHEADAILARIIFTTDRTALANTGLVIEAIPEILAWKQELFAALNGIVGPETIVATNTSSLSISTIAGFTDFPERVLGLHFFNPAPVQPLVEVITHDRVLIDVVASMESLMRALGKKPVTVADQPGFLVNALLVPYLNHAAHLLSAGDVEPADLDAAVVQAGFAPMGPAALIDLVGVDVHIEVCKVLHDAFGHEELIPAPSVQTLASLGHLGRKSKHGYYDYATPVETVESPSERARQYARWLNARHLNAATLMLHSGYASADDIDLAMMAGCGYKRGPITAVAEYGVTQVIADLHESFAQSGSTLDQPSERLLSAADDLATLRR